MRKSKHTHVDVQYSINTNPANDQEQHNSMLTGFKINSSSKVSNTVLLGLPDQSRTVSLGLPGCIFYMDNSGEVNKNRWINSQEYGNRLLCPGVFIFALNKRGKRQTENLDTQTVYTAEKKHDYLLGFFNTIGLAAMSSS